VIFATRRDYFEMQDYFCGSLFFFAIAPMLLCGDSQL
jgi:hypothetical protein